MDYTGTIKGDRIVRGIVSLAGAVVNGSGFSSSVSDGLYTITFSPAFSSQPTIVAMSNQDRANGVHLFSISASQAQVVFDLNGTLATTEFSFIAVGQ